MEYVDGGSLADLVDRCGPQQVDMVSRVAADVVHGLAHLHAQGMIHRDVKPGNILIDTCSGTHKLCDWISDEEQGCSEHGSATRRSKVARSAPGLQALAVSPVGTPVFLAPEVVRTCKHCVSSDSWGLGCTLINLITGRLPWQEEDNVFAAMFKTAHGFAPPYSAHHMGVLVNDFLTLCFEPDATLRPDAKDLLEHPLCLRVLPTNQLELTPFTLRPPPADSYQV